MTATKTYYASLNDAVSATNALSSSTGAVVEVCLDSKKNYGVFKLLADVTVSSNISFSYDNSGWATLIMLNGHTLTLSNAIITETTASTNRCLYIDGLENGSTVNMTGTAQIKIASACDVGLFGGTYIINNTTPTSAIDIDGFMSVTSDSITTYYAPFRPITVWNTNITATTTSTSRYYLINCHSLLHTADKLNGSQLLLANNTVNLTGADPQVFIARSGGVYNSRQDSIEFINETYKCNPTSSTSYLDSTAPAITSTVVGNLIVRNCDITGINDAISSKISDVFISDSKLTGYVHGGGYFEGTENMYNFATVPSDEPTSKTYIMNTEIIGGNTNPYSCYFGYGANVYCDGVSFKTYDGSDYTPAIKCGDTIGDPTIVHFSNCSMKSLRLDANCHAVLGLGISNTIKNAAYNGTKTVDNSVHRYKLVEEL